MDIINNSNLKFKKFKQLTYADKIIIETLIKEKNSVRQIAKKLNRSPSTISRHLNKYLVLEKPLNFFNKVSSNLVYSAAFDNSSAYQKRHRSRDLYQVLPEYLEILILKEMLESKYSIGAALHKFKKQEKFKQIKFPSLSNLYLQIKQNRLKYIKKNHLMQYKKLKNTEQLHQKRFYGVSITKRPETINNRSEFGHWEADTVVGKKLDTKCIFSMVERKTNRLIWKLVDKGSTGIIKAINDIFKYETNLASQIRSITFDNATEFAKTLDMQFDKNKNKRFDVYYARAYCSNDRAINECSNKLLRKFIPKSYSINSLTQEIVDQWLNKINNMPRKKYLWQTSQEIFNAMLE